MPIVTDSQRSATRTQVHQAITQQNRHLPSIVLSVTLLVAVTFTLLTLFSLLARIVTQAIPAFSERGASFLSGTIGSEPGKVGIWPGLFGSFAIGIGVLLIAVPLGIGAAIYLEEYAEQNRLNRFVVVNIRNLAGVPAVIYGVLGLIIFVGWLKPVTNGGTVVAAALTLAILVLPVVIITSMEAIRAVPMGLRDAGYGVGASRWEVTRDHVVPYAMPGILTGTVLALARALGEAAPLIMIGAITGLLPETSLSGKFTAIPMLIYSWSGRPDSSGGNIGWSNAAAGAGLVLLALVLVFNVIGIFLRNHFEAKRVGT
ncbi:phosphate transport system permease protein PstA [Actinomycetes bacterium]|nr:phosphate transport system permease protein PstA [Actinomycetes bacterium]